MYNQILAQAINTFLSTDLLFCAFVFVDVCVDLSASTSLVCVI